MITTTDLSQLGASRWSSPAYVVVENNSKTHKLIKRSPLPAPWKPLFAAAVTFALFACATYLIGDYAVDLYDVYDRDALYEDDDDWYGALTVLVALVGIAATVGSYFLAENLLINRFDRLVNRALAKQKVVKVPDSLLTMLLEAPIETEVKVTKEHRLQALSEMSGELRMLIQGAWARYDELTEYKSLAKQRLKEQYFPPFTNRMREVAEDAARDRLSKDEAIMLAYFNLRSEELPNAGKELK